jgi:hypothetical protein
MWDFPTLLTLLPQRVPSLEPNAHDTTVRTRGGSLGDISELDSTLLPKTLRH